jgi:two-component sensor histidine kinase
LRNEAGAVTGVGVVVEDVTAFKAAVQAREILSRELSHRIKNLFAVVSSLVTLSARGDKGFQIFARALRGRIEALGRAHDYVRPSEWDRDASRDRTLTNLLDTVLAPFRGESAIDGKPRIEIEGPDVPMGPFAATALALTLHELATNAAKYGALSRPAGKVGVTCEIKGDLVEVVWRERGGPPVAGPPEKEGFGSMLARRTFSADLGGAMEAEWQPEGLVLKLTAPLQRLAR